VRRAEEEYNTAMQKRATQKIVLTNVKLFAVTGGDGDKMIQIRKK